MYADILNKEVVGYLNGATNIGLFFVNVRSVLILKFPFKAMRRRIQRMNKC